MIRFRLVRLDDVVELGGGLGRLPEPGEELYRVVCQGITYSWMTEAALLELLAHLHPTTDAIKVLYVGPLIIESTVWPGQLGDNPDPRQLALPIGAS